MERIGALRKAGILRARGGSSVTYKRGEMTG